MTTTPYGHLLSRLQDATGANIVDLQCKICQNLLWKPVECSHCRNLYCSECVRSPTMPQARRRCQNYIEGKCHPVILSQLNRLRIACIHRNEGCPQVISYDKLEEHENECGYRREQCPGCRAMILAKDLGTHQNTCGLIKLTCPECHLGYARKDASSHTGKKCLQIQLLQGDSKLHRDFEMYQNKQTMMMNQIIGQLNQIVTKLQEQDRTIESLNLRLDDMSSRMPADKSLLGSVEQEERIWERLDQLKVELGKQGQTNQNVNRRFHALSSRIHPSIPSYPARWQMHGEIVAGDYRSGNELHQLHSPTGLFVDENRTVYVADHDNHRVVAWKENAKTGELLAGGNGPGDRLDQLNSPTNVIMDKHTDTLLVCDSGNQRVMRWALCSSSPRQGEVVIDNIKCWGLTIDDQGSLYVSDTDKHEVRGYDQDGDQTGTVVAGGHGPGADLGQLNWPTYLFVDAQFTLYISDKNNHRVMKWKKGAKEGTVVASEDESEEEDLMQSHGPAGLWVDGRGHVYVVGFGDDRVTRWEKGANQGTIIVGQPKRRAKKNSSSYYEGPLFSTQRSVMRTDELPHPEGLCFDQHGHLYVAEYGKHRVRRFSLLVD